MLIDGKRIANDIKEELQSTIEALTGRQPTLAVILVGEDPASKVYVKRKQQACEAAGIRSLSHHLPEETSEKELLSLVDKLNQDPNCDGILIQLPLPDSMDATKVMHRVDPAKDVDGFSPTNLGKLLIGRMDGFVPCTPLGIQVMLERCAIETNNKKVTIVGRSVIVGKPMAALLMRRGPEYNTCVTVLGREWSGLKEATQDADIVISAVGKENFITKQMIKEGAVVIDVGINRVEDPSRKSGYRLVGDVDFEGCKDKAGAITPVPGGVGPMTIAMLLRNTLVAYQRSEGLSLVAEL